jgi:transposase
MRQEHRAGEKMFVDFSGDGITIALLTGEVLKAKLFVAVLGASNLTVAAAGRAHRDADADVRLREAGIDQLDLATASALLHDGPGPIEHGHQRQATEGHEVARQTAHARLDALVVGERDDRVPRVLEARRRFSRGSIPPKSARRSARVPHHP